MMPRRGLLHLCLLVDPVRQSHAIALPIGTRPFGLSRHKKRDQYCSEARCSSQQEPDDATPAPANARAASADRRLDAVYSIPHAPPRLPSTITLYRGTKGDVTCVSISLE